MTGHAAGPGAWIISGWDALVVVLVWCVLVALYGVFRSVSKPDPDPIRPSGPVD